MDKLIIRIFFLFMISFSSVFSIVPGPKAKGMGLIVVAHPQDAMVGAINPAGMVWVGCRADLGLTYIQTNLRNVIEGNRRPPFLPNANGVFHSKNEILLPELGINRMLNDRLSVGVSVLSRGNKTGFRTRVPILGTSKNFVQVGIPYITPSVSYMITDCQSIGLGINIVPFVLFKIKGFENLRATSEHPHHVTNKNFEYMGPGIGFRLGWVWSICDKLMVGATYESKTWVRRTKKYTGIIPNKEFQFPQNMGVGITFKPTCKLVIGLEAYAWLWNGPRFFGNRLSITHPGGSRHSTGRGFRNQVMSKIGVSYDVNDCLTVRAGFAKAINQVPRSQTLNDFSLLLMNTTRATAGATYKWGCNEISIAYMHNFYFKRHGKRSIPAPLGGGECNLRYLDNWVNISYGRQF